jgi:hypothetical protein
MEAADVFADVGCEHRCSRTRSMMQVGGTVQGISAIIRWLDPSVLSGFCFDSREPARGHHSQTRPVGGSSCESSDGISAVVNVCGAQ